MASRTVRGVRQTLPPNTLVGRLGGSGAAQVVTLDDIARHLTSTGLVDAAGTGSAPPPSVVVAGTGIGVSVSGSNYTVSLSTPVSLANGGTGANLSATGGASKVLKQSSVGAAVTVGTLATTDLSDVTLTALAANQLLKWSGSAWANVSVSTTLDVIGSTQGNVLYRGGAAWAALAPGRAGQVFASGGTGANPSWAYPYGAAAHDGVSMATTGALPACTYNNGTSGIGATLTANANGALGTIDGINTASLAFAFRILVKDQANAAQNGVYLCTQTGDSTHPWIMVRVTDADQGDGDPQPENISGASLFVVQGGTANATTIWIVSSSTSPLVMGTSLLTFAKIASPTSGAGLYSALGDVTLASLADKDIPYYDNSAGKWKNTTLTAELDAKLGSTQGQIAYRNATVWTVLAVGTAGQVLTSGGPAANVSWGTAGGSSTLAGDTDVAITSPANTDALYYNKSATKWQNQRQHYDLVRGFVSGTMSSSQLLHLHRFVKGVTFPANFGDYLGRASQAGGSANATASTVINIDKATNAIPLTFSNVGTITFAAGTVTPTFASTAGATVSFSQGDQLRLIGPASADGTFAGFNWTLCGYEVEPPSGNTVWASFGHGIDTATGTRIARRRAVLGFAVDLDNNKIWVKLSNDTAAQWNNSGSATPVTNTGGYDIASVNNGVSVMPAFAGFFGSSVADKAILNTGNTTFQMSAPSGFTAWDTTTTTTWNPSDKDASITLTNSNLTASQQTTSGGWRAVRAISGSKHTGKWYFEITCDQADASNGWIAGVANASATLASFVGSDNNGVGFQSQQNMWKNGSGTGVAVAPFGFGSWRHTRGTSSSYHTGKWYFELTADAIDSGNGWMGGVANASASLDNYAGSDNNGASFQNVAGTETFWKNGSSGGVVITGITSGQNLGIAVDLDNNKMWCRVNGATWSGTSGNPATNTGGSDIATVNDGSSVMPAFSATQSSGLPDQATLRTKSTDQVYAAPAGFTAWDG